MASFGEILSEFKTSESDSVENITPLLEDASLRNGLVAWRSVTIEYKPASDCSCKDETSRWNWLWTQVDYDQSTFAAVSGTRTSEVGQLLTRLIGLRLIYPDGTINNLARQYLQAIIMSKLTGKRPGRPKKEQ